ncbi:S26 family signal peptidase [Gilliamella sp. Choc4-2]|uniref:signal peptidase I n=1 Tax=unclassified Gilliamella TaxID=2685620 RepID=UPI0004DD8589|nr:signal peptidase I [Gilliamella apicola]KFA59652.1 Signal peptidase I [Gilliamella apicola]OCG30073.1 S26 family signal peptidase [Gilliamella apicola]OCG43575.1 S26 family signal peptidase [Gilliamella apicola]OCG53546.1 S26 family signal peptidase [Gilliamella apicola]OCG64475.1 S26 family signal peptidase [Gilliamella apicola]
MAGTFAIILTLATFITGIFWVLEKYKWKPARQRKVEEVRKQCNGDIDGKILAEVGKPKGWIENLASFFPVLFVVFIIRSFLIEPFQIPSGSMMQTLLIGDFIAVQKYSYGLRDPITNTVLISTGHPKRGDVAVFKHPDGSQLDLIKRVVGLPGDKIVYLVKEKKVIVYPACQINDTNCTAQKEEPLDLHYSELRQSNWKEVHQRSKSNPNFYTLQQYKDRGITDSDSLITFNMKIRQETLGNKVHDILITQGTYEDPNYFYHQKGQPIATWVVPQGHYFMMGDNRDNSGDSRYFGFVPESNFVGKAVAIWMSFEKQPNEWPTGIRFSQIGGIH